MKDDREPMEPRPDRNPDGTPTNTNPTVTVADFGPAPIGVPNFVIDQFSIPPFLLPIYQACGTQYGIPWEVLASINRIETAFGTNLNVSSAGALGWMQFMPSTWKAYGVDANNDGRKDPYNPVDAICAAARYLKAAGGEEDLARAIFAYNHADWYVDEVLLYARQYGKLPDDLVGSLTGLTEGARFPVAANARYADDISEREAAKRAKPGKGVAGNAADVVSASPTRRGSTSTPGGRPGGRGQRRGGQEDRRSKKLGRYMVLEDAYGNRFTYAELGSVAEVYPVPKREQAHGGGLRARHPRRRPASRPAAASTRRRAATDAGPRPTSRRPSPAREHRGLARAPLRLPRALAEPRAGRPHRPARRAARAPVPRLRQLQGLLLAASSSSTARRWRWRRSTRAPRSSRAPSSAGSDPAPLAPTSTSRSSRPAAVRRRSTRSRSSTAGSCSRRPRSTARRARTRSRTPAHRSARSC